MKKKKGHGKYQITLLPLLTFVRSNIKNKWSGIVVGHRKTSFQNKSRYLTRVLILRTKNGNPMTSRIVHCWSGGCFDLIEPFELTQRDKDWIKMEYSDKGKH